MSRLGDRLATFGGARPDALELAPGQRQRYLAMGLVLIATAAVSAAAASFALAMALKTPTWVAVVVGICWGLVILAIDRMLVVGMPRQPRAPANLLLAIPRVALALVIGVVVATPLTLQVFEREIAAETEVMVLEAKQAFEEELAADPRYDEIPALTESVAAQRALIADGGRAELAADADYVAAQAATAAAQAAYDEANRVWLSELDGTEGTGIVGDGPITQSKKLDRDGKLAALDAAKAAEAEAKAQAEARIEAGSVEAVAQAEQTLAADSAELERLTAARDLEAARYDAAADQSTGMLARLDALWRIGERNGMLGFAHLMIALLFVCIELMPVLTKTLQNLMAPTAYDEVAQITDETIVAAERERAAERLRSARDESAPRLDVAEYRAGLRRESGRRVADAFVAKQEEAELAAVDEWAEQRAPFIAARAVREWEQDADGAPAVTAPNRG
ncbi:DUF4407 domain-containing protein [Agromyces sp. Leaf222]|uniref:DUF4407 domain-containing protein n=1 Tax=Agromyces sp. Leaf222 TaxID=1735688 RepID=UPI0007002151|nr:DUF4407 domain-containing protein [Agromyces sp. Leaf222]KQM81208.1 hypothetical protein ASE68_15485 [Agromyces sp. Leaf222]